MVLLSDAVAKEPGVLVSALKGQACTTGKWVKVSEKTYYVIPFLIPKDSPLFGEDISQAPDSASTPPSPVFSFRQSSPAMQQPGTSTAPKQNSNNQFKEFEGQFEPEDTSDPTPSSFSFSQPQTGTFGFSITTGNSSQKQPAGKTMATEEDKAAKMQRLAALYSAKGSSSNPPAQQPAAKAPAKAAESVRKESLATLSNQMGPSSTLSMQQQRPPSQAQSAAKPLNEDKAAKMQRLLAQYSANAPSPTASNSENGCKKISSEDETANADFVDLQGDEEPEQEDEDGPGSGYQGDHSPKKRAAAADLDFPNPKKSWVNEPYEETGDDGTAGSWIEDPVEMEGVEEGGEEDDSGTAGLGAFIAEKTSFWKPKTDSAANVLLTHLAFAIAKALPDVAAGNVPHRDGADSSSFFPNEYPNGDFSGTISSKAEHANEAIMSYALINPAPAHESGKDLRKEIANLPDGVFASPKMVKMVKAALNNLSDEARKAVQFTARDEVIGDAANAANITALFALCHHHVGEIFYSLLRSKFPKKGIFELASALTNCRDGKLVALGHFLTKLRTGYMAFASGKGKGSSVRTPSTELYVWLLQSFGMRVAAKTSAAEAITYVGAGAGSVNLATTKSDLPLAELLHTGFIACVLWFDLLVPAARGSNNDDASKFINALCSGRGRIVPVGGDEATSGFTVEAVEEVHRRLPGVFARMRDGNGGLTFTAGSATDDNACHVYASFKEDAGMCLEFFYTETAEEVEERGPLLHPLVKMCGQRSAFDLKTELEYLVDNVILSPGHTLSSLSVERETSVDGSSHTTVFAISDEDKVFSISPEKLITVE